MCFYTCYCGLATSPSSWISSDKLLYWKRNCRDFPANYFLSTITVNYSGLSIITVNFSGLLVVIFPTFYNFSRNQIKILEDLCEGDARTIYPYLNQVTYLRIVYSERFEGTICKELVQRRESRFLLSGGKVFSLFSFAKALCHLGLRRHLCAPVVFIVARESLG